MIFQHARFQIWNQNQHPYKHTLDDFTYTNPGLGTQVSSIAGALDYLFAVLYPDMQPAVATPGALPLVGNTVNQMRTVEDDGDGKAASYRWEQREGEASPSWHKIYDVDWGVDSILQAWGIKTQDVYISRYGYQDLDASGNAITGLYAGQTLYGGLLANSNLTFRANSGDGVGASTGFVQVADNFRPAVNSTFSSGTTSNRWLKVWTDALTVNTATITSGSYLDTSGAINFGSADLTTSGALSVGSLVLASGVFGTLTVTSGSITDTSGAITFDDENLVTTGTLGSGVFTSTKSGKTLVFDPDVGGNGSIISNQALISFGSSNLRTTGNLLGTDLVLASLTLSGSSISVTMLNTDLNFAANGSGVINLQSVATTLGITTTGTLGVTGLITIDNLSLDGNTLASTNTNGNIILAPNGSGLIDATAGIYPGTDSTFDFGRSANVWNKFWVDGAIGYGANEITIDTMLSLRDINSGVTAGMTIFYNGSKWVSSLPDTEIDHNTINNLTVGDVHTQYLFTAGRLGGQSIVGGTAASNNLTLESTSNVTKGKILTKDVLSPFTNASYSAGWLGTDLGDSSHFFRHVYTKGEHFNFRLENLGSNPASSSQNPGRLWFNTADSKVYTDTGTSIVAVGGTAVYTTDTSWDGSTTTKSVTVSGVTDARSSVWQLKDNSNDFEIIYCSITSTGSTNVTITVAAPLPAGSYRLVGVG